MTNLVILTRIIDSDKAYKYSNGRMIKEHLTTVTVFIIHHPVLQAAVL